MHIQPKEMKQYPFYLRYVFQYQKKKQGFVLYPPMLWGRVPFLLILFTLFWNFLDRKKSVLDPVLRSIVQVRVAQVNSCEFCIDYNVMNLLKRTGSLNKLDHLPEWQKSDNFTDLEKAAIEYAEGMSKTNVKISDGLMDSLKKFLSEDQIVELTALIAFQNMSAKFNAALGIPSQGMCKISNKNENA